MKSAIVTLKFAFLGALIVIAVLMAFDNTPQRRHDEKMRQTYAAWCKLENRTDITFEEWERLEQRGLLKRK